MKINPNQNENAKGLNGIINFGDLWKYSKKQNKFIQKTFFQDDKKYYWFSDDIKGRKSIILKIQYLELHIDDMTPKIDKDGLSFSHSITLINCLNDKKQSFFHSNKIIIENWYETMKKYCLLVEFNKHYEIIKKIGSGKSSCVFQVKARDERNSKIYAAKVIDSQTYSIDDILDEIKANLTLKNPIIPEYYGVFLENNKFILIFEYADGLNLLEYMNTHGRFSEKKAAIIIQSLLMGLDYIHTSGFVHKDIKLKNIIICDDGNNIIIKIIDFGLMKKIKEIDLSRPCGTPGFIAPEVLERKPHDGKADIYGLGITLYTMLTGTLPSGGSQQTNKYDQHQKKSLIFKSPNWKTLSTDVQNLIIRMTEYFPSSRCTINEALSSDWIKSNTQNIFSCGQSIQACSAAFKSLQNIEETKGISNLKQTEKTKIDEKIFQKYRNSAGISPTLALLPIAENIFSFMEIPNEKSEFIYNIPCEGKVNTIIPSNYDEADIANADDNNDLINKLQCFNHLAIKTKPC